MSPYADEHFDDAEAALLQRYFTNLDLPVFALVNLPEVVKGALFARYSRSPKSLRRLFLDEFVDELDVRGDATVDATVGLERAEQLYERVFFEYGDDSVAQLGGVHLACEQASNLLTKVLERGRLMAYLEQSTRYIAYDVRLPTGHYRYLRPPEVLDSPFGARYVGEMDRMFDTYAELLRMLENWLTRRYPKHEDDSDLVHRRALKAKALDALRGLLPAASLSNVGIYGTGQSYEMLLLHMRCHALPEVREYAAMMLDELRKVIPSFLQRVDLEDRGGVWSAYLATNRRRTTRVVRALWPEDDLVQAPGTARRVDEGSVVLLDFDPDGEDRVLAAICSAHGRVSERIAMQRVRTMAAEDRQAILAAYVGERSNRRHRPGRAFEATDYRFEIVSDYGAFRDLQRHRMLTIDWQPLSTSLGFDMPDIVVEAGLADSYGESMDRSARLHDDMRTTFPEQAQFAVALSFHIRYIMQMNAREAMHLIELRSGPQGHPSYRRVAQEMHRAITVVAAHHGIAGAMVHVDHGAHDLERLDSERKAETRRAGMHDAIGG